MAIDLRALEKMAAMRMQAEINAVNNTDEQALKAPSLYPDWEKDFKDGDTLEKDARVNYKGVLYKVLTTHQKQANWTPTDSPSLFTKVLIPDPGEIPEWEQPGPENAYSKGDKVKHNGKIWESLVDNNVWEPGVIGTDAQWKEVAE